MLHGADIFNPTTAATHHSFVNDKGCWMQCVKGPRYMIPPRTNFLIDIHIIHSSWPIKAMAILGTDTIAEKERRYSKYRNGTKDNDC